VARFYILLTIIFHRFSGDESWACVIVSDRVMTFSCVFGPIVRSLTVGA
jgi:hypothetical protein